MNIRKLRKKKGLTIEDIASKIGVSAMSLYRWETGKAKPHRTFLKKLEKILGEK